MIAKCRSVIRYIWLLAVYSCCASLPLSDVTLFYATPTELPEVDNTIRKDHDQLHKWWDDDLRPVLCPNDRPIPLDADIKCTDNNYGVFLSIGHCLTYRDEHGRQQLYEFKCNYFQLEGHQVSHYEPGYIKLPDNVSELNDYMCGPMNRKGFLCEEYIDNFSVSMTSIGNKCSNCTDVWYGIPLYLIVELVPITAFYLFILVFQIHITSPPMVSFIFYSQTLMFVLAVDRPPPLEKVVPQNEKNFWFNLNLFLYSPWNLDFLRYILPPFCVFKGLNMTYMAILSYLSVVYPLFLVFLTWVCIELYGRGFKPIVCIVGIFHKCLAKLKQDWGAKCDVIDVFSAFFLLSYSRLMYQSSLFLVCGKVTHIGKNGPSSRPRGINYIMNYDSNIACGSSKYIAIAAVSLLIILVFNVLPALLLVLYPFKVVRSCLSKCQLDTLSLSAFMDKFHRCYRNGLSEGRDMRSFAGLDFFVRCLFFLYYPFKLYRIPISFGSHFVLIFLSATLLIAIARPYRKSYKNVFDTLLLGHFAFISKLQTDDYVAGMGTQLFIVSLIPTFALGICLLYVKVFKVYNFGCCRRWRPGIRRDNPHQVAIEDDTVNSVLENSNRVKESVTQPLLVPTADSSVLVNNCSRKYESID